MTRLLSVVGLAWLYCTIGELQPIEYLKCVFLEILNVTTWSVFQNKVTYKCYKWLRGGGARALVYTEFRATTDTWC